MTNDFFPVVSADSDHRLLSGNPSGCWGQSTIWMPLRALGQVGLISRAAKRRQRVSKQGSLDTSDLSPLRGSITRDDLTQGSQSLGPGLNSDRCSAAQWIFSQSRDGM